MVAELMRRGHAAGTPATAALTRAGIAFTLHQYDHDPRAQSYGLEAAEAIGVPPEQVFKTLLVGTDDLAVAVLPVSSTLDLKALAPVLGWKRATMADPAVAERATGYVVGGISPLGQRRRLPTVVDLSAASYDLVYVSGGKRGLDLALAPKDLLAATSASTATIARR